MNVELTKSGELAKAPHSSDSQGATSGTRRPWMDYVKEICNQFESGPRSSGFTTWAICATTVFLALGLLQVLPLLMSSPLQRELLIVILTSTFNVLVFCGLLVLTLCGMFAPEDPLRLVGQFAHRANKVKVIGFWMSSVSMFSVNAVMVGLVRMDLPKWPYVIIMLWAFSNALSPIFGHLKLRLRLRTALSDSPQPDTPYLLRKPYRKTFFTMLWISTASMCCLASGSAIVALQRIEAWNHLELLKAAMEISAILFFVALGFVRLGDYINHQFMLNLRQRILLDDLSDHEIKSILLRDWFGQNADDWMESAQNEIEVAANQFIHAIKVAREDSDKIGKIDPEYAIEISARRELLCSSISASHRQLETTITRVMRHLDHLNKEQLYPNHVAKIQKVIVRWKTLSDRIKGEIRDHCHQCDKKSCPVFLKG